MLMPCRALWFNRRALNAVTKVMRIASYCGVADHGQAADIDPHRPWHCFHEGVSIACAWGASGRKGRSGLELGFVARLEVHPEETLHH